LLFYGAKHRKTTKKHSKSSWLDQLQNF